MTPRALAELREAVPGCELAAYVDYGSGTVLGADGALRYPQEYLDVLCDCAARLFAPSGDAAAPPPENVVSLTPTGARVFLRGAEGATEALCCICAPDTDFGPALAAFRFAIGTAA